ARPAGQGERVPHLHRAGRDAGPRPAVLSGALHQASISPSPPDLRSGGFGGTDAPRHSMEATMSNSITRVFLIQTDTGFSRYVCAPDATAALERTQGRHGNVTVLR